MPMAPSDGMQPEVQRLLDAGYVRYLSRRNDDLTMQLVQHFAEAKIAVLVLKGASTRWWLDMPDRPSGDVDLLVSPADRRRAEGVLRGLGYRRKLGVHADSWSADDRVEVDLHRTMPRSAVSPARAWSILAAHRSLAHVGGGDMPILDRPAHLVHLAIHATQDDQERSRSDLRRAAAKASRSTLDQAYLIASDLGVSTSVAWAFRASGLPDQARLFGEARLAVNAPTEAGWVAFGMSSVHWEERRRRAARVGQMWVRWNAGRIGRTLMLRSRSAQRLRARLRTWPQR